MKSRQLRFRLLISLLFNLIQVDLNAQVKTFNNSSGADSTNIHLAFESNSGDSLIKFNGYVVLFSYQHNLPLYTFHKLTKQQLILENIGMVPAKRTSQFRPWQLPNGKLSATNVDYKKSGFDRGHMVPAGDFLWNKVLKDQTFRYINIAPQTPNLNRGIWAHLENSLRMRVIDKGLDAYIVTGVIFGHPSKTTIGPNHLNVPVSFFKMAYFPANNELFAFLFDNTINYFEGDLSDFQVTPDFIELISGEDFFDTLDDEIEKRIESKIILFKD